MKTIKVYSDKDCVIRYGVWPEEPVLNMLDAFSNKRKEKWGDPLAHYSNALQKAKDESVCFEDQEQIKKRMYPDNKHKVNASYGEWEAEGLKPDTFYDIELDGEIEIVEVPDEDAGIDNFGNKVDFHWVARLLPSKEETREMSKYSNSEIGSHHWAATLLSFVMRVGEYLESHQHTPEDVKYYSDWGTGLKARAEEVNNYLQSLPDKPE